MENDLPIEDGRYWCKFYDDSYDVLEFSVENGWKYPEGVDSPVKKWMILAK